MTLDNAAKIFPAARTRTWSNVFRLSATMREEVDPAILQAALEDPCCKTNPVPVSRCLLEQVLDEVTGFE